jgi:hypothetical protein
MAKASRETSRSFIAFPEAIMRENFRTSTSEMHMQEVLKGLFLAVFPSLHYILEYYMLLVVMEVSSHGGKDE